MLDREQRVREIAHRLWEEEGRPCDQDKRHWATAERIFDSEQGGAMPVATSKRPQGRRTSKRTTVGANTGATTSH